METTLWQFGSLFWRRASRHPWLTAIQAFILAVGLGGSAIAYSVLSTILLAPLPFPDSHRIVHLWEERPVSGETRLLGLEPHQIEALGGRKGTFEAVAAYAKRQYRLQTAEGVVDLLGMEASASIFSVLGIQPIEGRPFTRLDQETEPNTLVVGHLFRSSLLFEGAVRQEVLTLDSTPFNVVGTLPPLPYFPDGSESAFWAPLAPPGPGTHTPTIARLGPGISLAQAAQELGAVLKSGRARVVPLYEHLFGEYKAGIWMLSGAAFLVWLLASVNVAGLQVATHSERLGEFTIRSALGASRFRLARSALFENLFLSLIGACAGGLAAFLGLKPLLALVPFPVPRLGQVELDAGSLLLLLACTLFSGLVCTAAQVLAWNRKGCARRRGWNLRSAPAQNKGLRLQSGLVVTEIGLALVLLNLGGMLTQSFIRLISVDPGYDPDGVLALELQFPSARYPSLTLQNQAASQITRRLGSLREVSSVGVSWGFPLGPKAEATVFADQGRLEEPPVALVHTVDSGYFPALGIELKAGSWWVGDEPGSVAVISESLARQLFGQRDPVGKRVGGSPEDPRNRVVGVVGDVRHRGLDKALKPEIYLPTSDPLFRFAYPRRFLSLRFEGDPQAVEREARNSVRSLDPEIRVSQAFLLEDRLAATVVGPKFWALLLNAFSALGLVIAMIGVYAIAAQSVQSRQREISVRMAVGASSEKILVLFLREGALLLALGWSLGAAVSTALAAYLAQLQFGLPPTSPAALLATSLILAGVVLAGFGLPAAKASRTDPRFALAAN